MLEEGLSYPAWGDRSIGRIVIGSLLWSVAVLLVPLIVLVGYGMRAMRQTARGTDLPPQWRGWTALLVDGLRGIVVSVVYALIPNVIGALILGAVFFLLVGGGATGGREGGILAGIGVVTLVFGAVVVIVVELIVVYLLPAALVSSAAQESIGAGFDVATISTLVVDLRYVTALVHLAIIGVVTTVVASILSVTVILLPATLFWGGLAAARVLGLAYRGVLTPTPADTTPATDPR